jgi:hypothetical protein
MEPAFARYAESLHPSFERLVAMPPVTIPTLPANAPRECVYLFSDVGKHLYVGRTRHLRQRMRQHSIPSSRHNQAVFAFRIARETTGRLVATYTGDGTRALPRWTGQNRPFVDTSKPAIAGERIEASEFYRTLSPDCNSVWTFVRQLRGPHFSTCA